MAGLTIKRIKVHDRDYSYDTFLVDGSGSDGQRIRRKFKDRDAAFAFKTEKEVEMANSDLKVRKTVTRLSNDQLQDAELAVARLGGQTTLQAAADYFVANYKAPSAANTLSLALGAFLAARRNPGSAYHVRPRSLQQCSSVQEQFRRWVAGRRGDPPVHEISRGLVGEFLECSRDPKTFNNSHSELNRFFDFCLDPDRAWVSANPVLTIRRRRLKKSGIPQVLSLEQARSLMAFVAVFPGTAKRKPGAPGQLSPYFALALFSGLRTDPTGELAKIARAPQPEQIIDLKNGIIRVPPEISKTGHFRSIKISTNLKAWLKRFPGPILPGNHHNSIAQVRKKFGIGRDVLRHTWYSMHVAAFRSVTEAALQGGSSEYVVKRHYLDLAQNTQAEAKAFWKISPATGNKR
jgi:integrase